MSAVNEKAERAPAPGVTVERVTHEDVPHICALLKRVWENAPGGLPPELLKAWQPTPLEFTSRMEGVTFFAGRREGKLVGLVGCEVRHGACRLVQLVVDPDVRRQGVATALLGTSIEWARRSNASVVWGDTLSRFTAAAAVLKHLGFTECGVLHRHEWNEDVRLFERLL